MIELCRRCRNRVKGISEAEVVEVPEEECTYCCGLFLRIPEVAEEIAERLRDYELHTIQVGCALRGSIREIESFFEEGRVEETKVETEVRGARAEERAGETKDISKKSRSWIKQEINYELSKKLCELMNVEDVRRKRGVADLTVDLDAEDLSYEIRITPLYIYGRYVKRVRNIPQTRWLCSACGGKGCQVCGFTGKKYSTSVEELIGQPCLNLTKGEDAVLHGAGREDVDARMLGRGRPFILEVRKPKIRSVGLRDLEKAVNDHAGGRVSVMFLAFAEPKHVSKLKTAKYRKKYRAVVEFEREVSEEELRKALEELSYRVIEQFTPERVEHRRANILRKRKTYKLDLLLLRGKKAVITVEADSGLYIKELVSGDKGRTKPSLSEILNNPSRVVRLDVLDVIGGLEEFESV